MLYEELMSKYKEIQQQFLNSQQENLQLKIKIENQELAINSLRKYIFGSKRESTVKNEDNIVEGTQCSIFGTINDPEVKQQVEEKTEGITVYRKKNSKKVKTGIKKSELKNIETVTEEYILEDDKKVCPTCNSDVKQIGKELVRQEIQYIPAKFKLVNYVRYIYKCVECGTENNKKETATIIKTKTPNPVLAHSFASSSLATEVIYQKYFMGVPLYRQEKIWNDRGLVIPRNMMANWCIKLSEYYFAPIRELMLKELKEQSEVLHSDETTIQCNKEKGRKASSNSYMWVVASGKLEKKKGVVFHYSKSRREDVAKNLLSGYKNILVTDGYAGYNVLEKDLIRAECWAHARRYFYESVPLDENKKMIQTSAGYQGVLYIDQLFEIERDIEELSLDEKLAERQEKSAPILEKFYEWVYSTSQKYVVNKKLKEALTYAVNQKKNLSKFLNDARIPLSNSMAERAIRPFAIHRKNWLFADTVDGARANAILYTIIESAKINNININKYIKYLLDVLPQLEGEQREEDLYQYLPWSELLPKEILNAEEPSDEIKEDKNS